MIWLDRAAREGNIEERLIQADALEMARLVLDYHPAGTEVTIRKGKDYFYTVYPAPGSDDD